MAIRTVILGYSHDSVKNSSNPGTFHEEGNYNNGIERQGPQRPYISFASFKMVNGTFVSESNHFKVVSDETTHVGMVVEIKHTSERIMSDVWDTGVWAVAYNPTKHTFETKFLHYVGEGQHITERNFAEVDATDLVKEIYSVWKLGKQYADSHNRMDAREQEAYQERITPNNGKWVEVVKGRNVPKGTKGKVFWTGSDNYGKVKLGIATSNRKDNRNRNIDVVWTAQSNCIVTNIPTF